MNKPRQNSFRATAIFLAFALVQVSLQSSFAESNPSSFPPIPQGILGRITTTGSLPASINGNTAATGDSVVAGSLVQTPSGTEATIDLGTLGSIKLHSGTRIRLDYACPAAQLSNPDPQSCRVYVTLFVGCVTSNYKQGSHHQIAIDNKGLSAQSDPEKERNGGGVLDICSDRAPAGAAATEGIDWTRTKIGLLVAAISVPAVIILIAGGDNNPSPSTP